MAPVVVGDQAFMVAPAARMGENPAARNRSPYPSPRPGERDPTWSRKRHGRHHQGGHSRHRRRLHRISPGLLDRAPAAAGAFLRFRRPGFRQHLRDPDPVRRYPRPAVDLFHPTGAALHGFSRSVLFNPWIVCVSLIVGGVVLVWLESLSLKPRYHDVTTFSMPMYLGIGICQCMAMIPSVSRSGATIVSAMLLGADRRAAAEFSFWLAMPTMAGAFTLDLLKSRHDLSSNGALLIAIGFAVSFIFGWIVVKTFLGYVARHGFMVFAWWRLIVGAAGLAALMLGFGAG